MKRILDTGIKWFAISFSSVLLVAVGFPKLSVVLANPQFGSAMGEMHESQSVPLRPPMIRETPTPDPGDRLVPSATPTGTVLCISEVMYYPKPTQAPREYIEIVNISDQTLDLTGWMVADEGAPGEEFSPVSSISTLEPGQMGIILAGSYDGFYDSKIALTTVRFQVSGQIGTQLQNDDRITIFDQNGNIVGTYAANWDPLSFVADSGQSVEIEDYYGGDEVGNYHLSSCPEDSTGQNSAGAINCPPVTPTPYVSPNPSVVPTYIPGRMCISEVMTYPVTPQYNNEFVEIRNISSVPIDVTGWYVSDSTANGEEFFTWEETAILQPGQFGLILSQNYSLTYDSIILPETVLFHVDDKFGGNGLQNSDRITIRDENMDIVCTYAATWDPENFPEDDQGRSVEIEDYWGPDAFENYHGSYCQFISGVGWTSAGAPNCLPPPPTETVMPSPSPTPTKTPSGTPPTATPDTSICYCGLRISEVMFNATKVDSEATDDDNDFVELKNCSDEPWDISNFTLYLWEEEGEGNVLEPYGTESIIPAQGYALIVDPDYEGVYTTANCVMLTVPSGRTLGRSNLDPGDRITICSGPYGQGAIDTFGGFGQQAIEDQSVERLDLCTEDIETNWSISYCPRDARNSRQSAGRANCPKGQPLEEGRLVVTEVMCDPFSTEADFIEIYNPGAAGEDPVNLDFVLLSDATDDNGILNVNFFTSLGTSRSTLLYPGQHALVVQNSSQNRYDGEYDDTTCSTTLLLTTNDGQITKSGLDTNDPVLLLNFDKSRIDAYSQRISTADGVSEEKNIVTGDDVETNWKPAMCFQRHNGGYHSAGASNCSSPPLDYEGPFILMAGFWDTSLSASSGGTLSLVALTWSPDENATVDSVEVYFDGNGTGFFLDSYGQFYFEGLLVHMFATMDLNFTAKELAGITGDIFLQFLAKDSLNRKSKIWPFLWIRGPESGCHYEPATAPAPQTVVKPESRLLPSGGLAIGSSGLPQILAAGFWTTDANSRAIEQLKIRALLSDPLGIGFEHVELYYQDQPTGIYLMDDGRHDDAGTNDGIFGFTFPLDPWRVELEEGRHRLSILATTHDGRVSSMWPNLTIR